jgi:hypothetical protein
MKVALCFIINYDHILNKEDIWKKWIEPNKDIINVYFYYKDLTKIKSEWILKHAIPSNLIQETSYYYVVPAYLTILNYAYNHNIHNKWFCMLTDSCCPIISPKKFRYLFYKYYNKSIISCKKAWWNITFHSRANLALLPNELHLANDAWFTLKRENVIQCINFVRNKNDFSKLICAGGLANESLFAIILYIYGEIKYIMNCSTHIIDWNRRSSPTSPHIFKDGDKFDIQIIEQTLKENEYTMFIRKISPDFPNKILEKYIYEYSVEADSKLILHNPFIIIKIYNFLLNYFMYFIFIPLVVYLLTKNTFFKI